MSENTSVLARLFSHTETNEAGCWEWQGGRSSQGYGRFRLDGHLVLPHRLAFELFYRPLAEGECVLHRCDNPPCCNPHHLFAGSKSDNMRDCAAKGRTPSQIDPTFTQGERRKNAKLTNESVREIRRAAAQGEKTAALAARFGVARSIVGRVVNRKRWAHVQ